MDKRKLGQLEVSPIGMGCMGFSHGYGQVPPEAYAIEAIRGAYDYGCTHFDTAEAYGKEQFYAGHNEELVGKAIEPFRKKVVLATKFHIGELSKPDETNLYREVRRHLEDSMSRLRTDYIDLYYLHRISEAFRLEDVATVMGRLIQEGLIRGWGLSQVSPTRYGRHIRLLHYPPSRTSIRWWNAIAKRRFFRYALKKESESYRSRRLQADSFRAR